MLWSRAAGSAGAAPPLTTRIGVQAMTASAPAAAPGYAVHKPEQLTRLHRIEGQVAGITRARVTAPVRVRTSMQYRSASTALRRALRL